MKKLYFLIAVILLFFMITNFSIAENSEDLSLETLRLDVAGLTPNFEKNVNNYYLTVGNEINNIQIEAVAENQNATVEVTGNNDLKEGLNIITINVISSDKSKNNIYTIQVTKTDDFQSANTNLETLAIENVLLNPPFDTNVTNYNIEISNELNELNILAIPEDINATVEIIGNKTLQVGDNFIYVRVTAQNEITKREYLITAYKRNQEEEEEFKQEQETNQIKLDKIYEVERMSASANNSNNTNNLKQIIFIIVGAILFVIIIFVYLKKRNSSIKKNTK